MSSSTPLTSTLGYPRIGPRRELKTALEDFWLNQTRENLLSTAKTLRRQQWSLQQASGITVIPSNDFSLYDHVLDMLVLLGATPSRFGRGPVTLERYFQMARNSQDQTAMEMTKWFDMLVLLGATPSRFGRGPVTLERYFQMARNSQDQTAMEMTKWFDTNYHYLVPEWSGDLSFQPAPSKALEEFQEARELGITTRPVLIGPVSLLLLGKSVDGSDSLALLPQMLAAYDAVLKSLAAAGAEWVQLDEPFLVTDLKPEHAAAYRIAYAALAQQPLKILLATYFGDLGENLELTSSLPVAGLHIDAVRAPNRLPAVIDRLGADRVLSIGCVDGRNIWIADLDRTHALIRPALEALGTARLLLAPSCSLLHTPYDASEERALDSEIRSWLSFSKQKLDELRWLSLGPQGAGDAFSANRKIQRRRAQAATSINSAVRGALASLEESDFRRELPYVRRAELQRKELNLPLLPTTTIGSFPQTFDVRKQRAARKSGALSQQAYDAFLRSKIEDCVRIQEEIGLDVLVHGEFERNDMVEYFGEQLAGFAFTQNGWVQSYGSRCVKPPIIFGDVFRPAPMTVVWSRYAAGLSKRPMKGMLTGPITILQWSFVRDDIPEKDVAWQIALALREELRDLENAGIRIIQVDEPALREGLPLRRSDWPLYLDWSVKAFRLATSGVLSGTQIHTHMCYSEFEDILEAIAALDADVISIESARSKMELLRAFRRHGYPNEIGPGIYDIHSPRVPTVEEMLGLLRLALDVLQPGQLWVNPDCGLKTRAWPETTAALKNMCEAAKLVRAALPLAEVQ